MDNLVISIWHKYDGDGNGLLDRHETQKFVADMMNDITPGQLKHAPDEPTTPDGFDDIFR